LPEYVNLLFEIFQLKGSERIESKTALGRFADPREVAEMSAAILKNEYMTGSVVEISGGYGLG
jgi:NAD(P)-dependent dehydrogenase (short-subunit alcohol dehydrogenase family)